MAESNKHPALLKRQFLFPLKSSTFPLSLSASQTSSRFWYSPNQKLNYWDLQTRKQIHTEQQQQKYVLVLFFFLPHWVRYESDEVRLDKGLNMFKQASKAEKPKQRKKAFPQWQIVDLVLATWSKHTAISHVKFELSQLTSNKLII